MASVNMTVDISERKQAEQMLAERNAQLALAGQFALVGTFTFDVDVGADAGVAWLCGHARLARRHRGHQPRLLAREEFIPKTCPA